MLKNVKIFLFIRRIHLPIFNSALTPQGISGYHSNLHKASCHDLGHDSLYPRTSLFIWDHNRKKAPNHWRVSRGGHEDGEESGEEAFEEQLRWHGLFSLERRGLRGDLTLISPWREEEEKGLICSFSWPVTGLDESWSWVCATCLCLYTWLSQCQGTGNYLRDNPSNFFVSWGALYLQTAALQILQVSENLHP